MLRSLILLWQIFLILNILNFVASFYTITAPGTIRSNRKYTVCATLHNVSQPANFIIGLRHKSTWSDNQNVLLQPMETKLLEFFPPKLDLTKQYELFVEGVKGLYFFNSTQLLVGENEGFNIYIETDRGAYKPGDLVQFRIVILDEHARAVKIKEPIKVQIFDGLGNRVKQFKDISLSQSVYKNEFQLSKEPVLGSWFIKICVGGKYAQERSAAFEVAKYVLPKFFVIIETEKNIVANDRYLKIIVYGRYTYKKLVEGKVDLIIRESHQGFTTYLASFAADTVDFKAIFEIDLNDLSDKIIFNRLHVSASLMEKQTGVTQSVTTVIYIHQEPYNITMIDNEMEFKNGKPSRIKVKIQHWNNTAVNDREASVLMQLHNNTLEAKLDEYGVASFENEFKVYDRFYICYKNCSKQRFYIPMLYTSFSWTDSNKCDFKLINRSSRMVDVIVESSRNIQYLVYILTSHGNIIKSEIVQLEGNQNFYTIQLLTSNEMVPVSFLYVHYIERGCLTYCEMKIELPEKLENEFSMSAPKNVKPGENITMIFNAQPGSRIAITAVDLSSMLVNVGNRIKKADILGKMRKDSTYSIDYTIHPGIFSGLIILSDVPYETPGIAKGQSIPSKWSDVDSYVRSYFPETWIYLDINVTSAITTINFTLPDTITTWVLTAFSMKDKTGIGLLDADVQITATKSFFISTYLPYSIKLGEIVSIPIVIFNYHSECLNTEVLMENPLNEFQFVDDVSNMTTNSAVEKRNIIVPANNGKSVNFLIKAQKLGYINFIVHATNKLARDKVLQKLLVEANGLETSHNHELYINMKQGQNYTTLYKPSIPVKIEPDTAFLQLSISGDVLLPSLDHIDNLVNKPTGCGEQNMIKFAPNILVLEYLSVTGQRSKYTELVARAQKYTEIGYQQELKFRHSNGGYSVFGPEHSKTPSNWLTAYVVRFFIKAVKYLPIETKIIDSSLQFLAESQLSSGEFSNSGYLFRSSYRDSKSFTAFVLLSFLENAKYAKKYQNVIQKAFNFLSNNIIQTDDIYSLAIMSTVFHIGKHEQASVILDKLKPLAKTKNNHQWWQENTVNNVTNVEIKSYILLSLLHTPGHYLPIANWLIEQRNSHGGFKSTQDTVVGFQALIKFAQFSAPQNDTMIKVLYKALNAENEQVEYGIAGLEPETIKTMQHYQLPPSTRTVDIQISGTGNIFLQFSYNYRKTVKEIQSSEINLQKIFIIKRKAELIANALTMNLGVCIQYKPQDDNKYLKTNMIIAEVDLPSGYIVNEENIEELKSSEDVDRIENDTPDKIIFYLTYIEANEEKCIDLVADNKHDVRNLKPSMIVVYEYYHPDHREVVTYEIRNNKNL